MTTAQKKRKRKKTGRRKRSKETNRGKSGRKERKNIRQPQETEPAKSNPETAQETKHNADQSYQLVDIRTLTIGTRLQDSHGGEQEKRNNSVQKQAASMQNKWST